MTPLLVVVIGANGAGKSTWCHAHRDELPANFYDADSIAQGLGSYNDPDLQPFEQRLFSGIDARLRGRQLQGEVRPPALSTLCGDGVRVPSRAHGPRQPQFKNRLRDFAAHTLVTALPGTDPSRA